MTPSGSPTTTTTRGQKDWIKYDTDGETIFVVVEQTSIRRTAKDKLVIDDGDINDMFVRVNGDIVLTRTVTTPMSPSSRRMRSHQL